MIWNKYVSVTKICALLSALVIHVYELVNLSVLFVG